MKDIQTDGQKGRHYIR